MPCKVSAEDLAPAAAAPLQRPGHALETAIAALGRGYSIEVTPAAAARIARFADVLPPQIEVFITSLPGSDARDMIALASRLRREGFEPVPHLAARSIVDAATLDALLARARGEADVTRVLAIAGNPTKPAGAFEETSAMLATGLFERHGITSISVAGHPEGLAGCSDAALIEALRWKERFARQAGIRMEIISQFCFEPAPLIAYDRRLRREGIGLPLRVGIAGVATLKTLISYAVSCGVGSSIGFLRRQAANVTRLLRPEAPDRLLLALASHRAADPESRVSGLHYFPLGGLPKTAIWANGVGAGAIVLDGQGGFQVPVT